MQHVLHVAQHIALPLCQIFTEILASDAVDAHYVVELHLVQLLTEVA